MWPAYVPDTDRDDICYASPMHAKYFGDLPPAFVEIAEFDCLRDEAINYANAMKNAGVDVELFDTKGTMHGFDNMMNAPTSKMAIAKRIEFMKKYF
jgi:acetyl esterase/lipase